MSNLAKGTKRMWAKIHTLQDELKCSVSEARAVLRECTSEDINAQAECLKQLRNEAGKIARAASIQEMDPVTKYLTTPVAERKTVQQPGTARPVDETAVAKFIVAISRCPSLTHARAYFEVAVQRMKAVVQS